MTMSHQLPFSTVLALSVCPVQENLAHGRFNDFVCVFYFINNFMYIFFYGYIFLQCRFM